MKRFLISLIFMLFCSNAVLSQEGLKVFISADIEGITSVVNHEQSSERGRDYNYFRRIMTAEVNSAIEGALEAGATDILVADSHGLDGINLIVDDLNPAARLIRSWPRPLMMMEGIDETFDAVILIGYHAGEQIPGAVLAHTMHGGKIFDLKLNGKSVNEAVFSAATAGHFNVPVVLISGDDAVMEQTKEFIPDFEQAIVKRAIGFYSANNLHPQKAKDLIKNKTVRALKNLKKFKPFKLEYPVKMEITFKSKLYAEIFSLLPVIKRTDSHTIEYRAEDMVEISKFISFLFQLNPN
ncbi:M55 family metallopeptidase [candidate division KSB1 bacterium]